MRASNRRYSTLKGDSDFEANPGFCLTVPAVDQTACRLPDSSRVREGPFIGQVGTIHRVASMGTGGENGSSAPGERTRKMSRRSFTSLRKATKTPSAGWVTSASLQQWQMGLSCPAVTSTFRAKVRPPSGERAR